MSSVSADIRNEIRAILREELSALRQESQAVIETVRLDTSSDLNRFVADLLARATAPDFMQRINTGQLRFELIQNKSQFDFLASTQGFDQMPKENLNPASVVHPVKPAIVASPVLKPEPGFEKNLVTERDIASLDTGTRSLRLAKHSRLTPLAQDEVNRKGIRIVRIEQ